MKPAEALRQISSICAALRTSHPARKFPIDGMLVGDIGEVLAAERFGLRIVAQSQKGWDAETSDGRKVEIKATAKRLRPGFGFRDEIKCPRTPPDFVVCLQLKDTGAFEVVFNGPGHVIWPHLGNLCKANMQRVISARKLSALMEQVPQAQRLKEVPSSAPGSRQKVTSNGRTPLVGVALESRNTQRSPALLNELDAYYRSKGIHPLDFRCRHRSECSAGCDDFREARASLVGRHYEEPGRPKIAVLSLDPGSSLGTPAERTLQAARDRHHQQRVESLPKGRHWYETHEIVAAILGEFDSDTSVADAVGRFAHVNAAKCCQNKPGRKIADAKLFRNCRSYLGEEFEILQPDVIVTQGGPAHGAMKGIIDDYPQRRREVCNVVTLGGREVFWLRLHHPGAWHGVYTQQKADWPKFVSEISAWWAENGEADPSE